MSSYMFIKPLRLLTVLQLTGIVIVLFMAFFFQFMLGELPCPLCLLQRLGFFGIAFGFLMNLRFGMRPSHYAIVIISSVYTGFVALRQVALHVVPGTGTYGDPFFGLHLYTWVFIVSIIILVVTTCMLAVDRQYQLTYRAHQPVSMTTNLLFLLITLLLCANIIAILFECGFSQCPDNPTTYQWAPFKKAETPA